MTNAEENKQKKRDERMGIGLYEESSELRFELYQALMFIQAVKTRFYLAMTGWAATGVFLAAHYFFNHR